MDNIIYVIIVQRKKLVGVLAAYTTLEAAEENLMLFTKYCKNPEWKEGTKKYLVDGEYEYYIKPTLLWSNGG